jgi:hypothetical protein
MKNDAFLQKIGWMKNDAFVQKIGWMNDAFVQG